jgi:hypothetical protein
LRWIAPLFSVENTPLAKAKTPPNARTSNSAAKSAAKSTASAPARKSLAITDAATAKAAGTEQLAGAFPANAAKPSEIGKNGAITGQTAQPSHPSVTGSTLSLFARPGKKGIKTRHIAMLVADGVDAAAGLILHEALLDQGAAPRFVGTKLGQAKSATGDPLDVEISLETAPSVLWDALTALRHFGRESDPPRV